MVKGIVWISSHTNTYSMSIDGMPVDTNMLLDATIPLDLSVRVAILIAALGLDALVGDPHWLWGRIPHPVMLFGRMIAGLDILFNRPQLAGIRLKGKARRVLGVFAIILLVGIACAIGSGIVLAASAGGILLTVFAELLLVAILLAGRSLADHARVVAVALESNTINKARTAVSKIVGRNTEALDRSAIARATIESTAENLSDGVIAPALFYVAFGLPGILAYKMVNTADSMIGYRSARHFAFGWGTARLDDLANLVPARLTGLLIAFVEPANAWRTIGVMLRDAPHHHSPNAGWPEASIAAQLQLSLAGQRAYGRRIRQDREINQGANREAKPTDIVRAYALMWRVAIIFALLLGMVAIIWEATASNFIHLG